MSLCLHDPQFSTGDISAPSTCRELVPRATWVCTHAPAHAVPKCPSRWPRTLLGHGTRQEAVKRARTAFPSLCLRRCCRTREHSVRGGQGGGAGQACRALTLSKEQMGLGDGSAGNGGAASAGNWAQTCLCKQPWAASLQSPCGNRPIPADAGWRTTQRAAGPVTPVSRSTPSPVDPDSVEVLMNFDPDPADLALSSVPGHETFDPRKHRFSEEELKPQPIMKKARKIQVPEEQKDEKYWSRRYKNNEAAKRSRDARRLKENQITVRAAFLEKENAVLRQEVAAIRQELSRYRSILSKYEAQHGAL
ncbi:D site-binding protein isoform X3 [Alligator sinensis]|uniref:D site-binding protein isoform X3 n=1 Tax=Alligator sinensis TaxID=38654 RepID=A0A3Q0GZG9_ALLSI|nr:D site-binding protein isoform X3 [Alligator sinensis]